MPIPFHDVEEIEELGAAAFLHVEQPAPGSAERFGALLFINARGEPLEFVYNHLELLSDVLWRPADRTRAAVRRLAATLFHAATLTPALLLCRADVVDPHLFGPAGHLSLEISAGRIATAAEAVGYAGVEQQETVATADSAGQLQETHVFWTPAPPGGAAAALFARLADRGLLLEPFDRAGVGLREVYGDPLGVRR
jgi:hypothetical protein